MYNSNFQYTQDKLSVLDICLNNSYYGNRACLDIPDD